MTGLGDNPEVFKVKKRNKLLEFFEASSTSETSNVSAVLRTARTRRAQHARIDERQDLAFAEANGDLELQRRLGFRRQERPPELEVADAGKLEAVRRAGGLGADGDPRQRRFDQKGCEDEFENPTATHERPPAKRTSSFRCREDVLAAQNFFDSPTPQDKDHRISRNSEADAAIAEIRGVRADAICGIIGPVGSPSEGGKMTDDFDFDYIVIGSGFGGSVSAYRLTEKGYRVAVLEQGRRWTPDNLPSTNWKAWDYLWRPALGLKGFLSLRLFSHVLILDGAAVGGGSITYAQTLLTPPDSVWSEGEWAGLDDWRAVMPMHYATAKRMLGVTRNRRPAAADFKLRDMAKAAGVDDSFYLTDVGVFFGNDKDPPGAEYADPFFGGEGPTRNSCIGCGGCMTGCRFNAKNTLDKNYLYLAEKGGAEVRAETKAVDVRPIGAADGSDGYEVFTEPTFARWRKPRTRLTARKVIVAASSLGTLDLLFKLKEAGSLPMISDALGKRVRTNAESILGVRYPGTKEDMSKGVAIGSGIYIDEHTHIEAVRYAEGSNLLSSLLTTLTGGRRIRGRVRGHAYFSMQ
jgi:ferredoxin